MNVGDCIEFRGKDDRVIIRIPIKNLCADKTGNVSLKGLLRKVLCMQVKLQFWDQKQNEQSILFYVQEGYVDSMLEKIDAKKINIKDVNNDVSYIIEDVKDLGNLEHAEKFVITPIELGNSIEFRGKDDRVILRIPIKSISQVYKTARIMKHWLRDVLDLLIRIQFLDQEQNEQTVFSGRGR